MDSRVTKTNGLIEALKMHDLSLDELCVFGDADNDYDMVKNAAMGVVMANGSEKRRVQRIILQKIIIMMV